MMKIKYVKSAFVVAFALVAGYGVYTSQQENSMSHLAMANVEALATNEENPLCPNGCVDNGNGCACNGIYVAIWREYEW